MTVPAYRLAIAATAPEMHQIAAAITGFMPAAAAAIAAQASKIQNTGVNIFGCYEHQPGEPIVGLTRGPIEQMGGIPD
ncbi:hypothetical protein GCM10022268_25410 [Sphingomonas cynarae]|uniref:Uncharacterized protein n=1 Tax=Sphingomonas cynarae TaxID=930197 RepID=A0ABP7EDV4_9SPHN